MPPGSPKAQLYDMSADVGEQKNLFTAQPELGERLLGQLASYIKNGRSTEGPESKNDTDEIVLWKSEKSGQPRKKKKKKGKDKQAAVGEDCDSEKRPNILFIIADDQSPFDFKFYNPRSTLNAPNIEGLAAEGMVF